jgi:hypothetical protein
MTKDLEPHCINSLTLYKKDGTIVNVIPLTISGTSHKTRCSLVNDFYGNNWHHYTMHETNRGMKKWDWWMLPIVGKLFRPYWYVIDMITGKIIKRT